MVAIFTGLGAGFERGSAASVGGGGLLGSGSLGRGGEGVFLNAATGNLLLTRQDEFLIGRGPDLSVARTYNSLGALNENGDHWRQSTDRRVFGLTGTLNAAGSTVKRVSADGSEITYTWSAAHAAYVATDGEGAFDKLVYGSGAWTWTDGSTLIREIYEGASTGVSFIKYQRDTDGNQLTFTYNASNQLTKVETQDGGAVSYTWDGAGNIIQLTTTYKDLSGAAVTLNRTAYEYNAGRLTKIKVEPVSGGGSFYEVNYTYVGATNLIETVSQTDGSFVQFSYDASNRVEWIRQTVAGGNTRTTQIVYAPDNSWTDIRVYTQEYAVDAPYVTTRLKRDALGQLTEMVGPPPEGSGSAVTVKYDYDAQGNLTRVRDAANKETLFAYDAFGNVTQITDANNNVTTRFYNADNQIVRETRNGSDGASANTQMHTCFVYGAANKLRYTISADGRVTEFRYNASGQVEYTIDYADYRYDLSPTSPTETDLNTWRGLLPDHSGNQIVWQVYDERGGLTDAFTYSAATTGGGADPQHGYRHDTFKYDHRGLLRLRGTTPYAAPNTPQESFVYDALGRLTGSTDVANGATSIVFNDAATTTTVTTASGHVTVSVYNKAGELVSRTETDTTTSPSTTLGTPDTFAYDKRGRLRFSTDSTNRTTYFVYDDADRKVGEVRGADLVEYIYDLQGRLTGTVNYKTVVSAGALALLGDANSNVTIGQIRPTADSYDLRQWTLYDDGGRVIETIAGDGAVTTYEYDAANRLVKTRGCALKLNAGQIASLIADPRPASIVVPATDAKDVVLRTFYDRDGRAIGALNALGFLTETIYDGAGQIVRTIAYASATANDVTLRASGTLTALRNSIAQDAASDISTRYVYDGQGLLRYTIDALNRVTELVYSVGSTEQAHGKVRKTISYATPLVLADGDYRFVAMQTEMEGLDSVNDRISHNAYNSIGQLTYVMDAAGALTSYKYDTSGRVIRTTQFAKLFDGTLGVESAEWDATFTAWAAVAQNQADARLTRAFYDSRGAVRFTTDGEGFVSENIYDAEGRVVTSKRYANAQLGFSDTTTTQDVADTNKGTAVSKQFVYDTVGRLAYVYDANGNNQHMAYFGNGLLAWKYVALGQGSAETRTRFLYDQAGHLLSETAAYGTTEAATTTYTYDGLGNVQNVRDARNVDTAFTYDKAGRVLTKTEAVGAAAQRTTTFEYDAFGRGVRTIDARGNSSYAFYDQAGRVAATVDAEGYVTTTAYTAFGDVSSVTRFHSKETTNYITNAWLAGGTGMIPSRETIDGALSLVLRNDHGEFPTWDQVNAWGGGIELLNGDRPDGRITVVAGDTVDYSFRIKPLDPGLSVHARFAFLHADGSTSYGANVTVSGNDWTTLTGSATAPAGAIAVHLGIYGFRADGNVNGGFDFALAAPSVRKNGVQLETRLPKVAPNALDATTSFAYDKLGRAISTTDAEIKTETYELNAFGQRTKLTNKLGGVTRYEYNDRGLLEREIRELDIHDENGVLTAGEIVTEYTYDSRGNRITITEAKGREEERFTSYVYDAGDRLVDKISEAVQTVASAVADLSAASTPVEHYTYDARNNLIKKVDALNGETLFWYDQLNRVTHQVSATGTLTTFVYDGNGNVTSSRTYATRLTLPLNPAGPAPAPGGASRVVNMTYDGLNRLIETRTPSVETAVYTTSLAIGSQDLVTSYAYDAAGNVVRVTDANLRHTHSYYDRLGRKIAQIDAENYRTDWTYNSEGNVLSEVRYSGLSTTPSITPAPPAPPTANANDRTTNFTYDRAGRRLTETRVGVIVHNDASPGSETTQNATISYAYNALGQVTQKTEASGDVFGYLYDDGGRMTQETRATFIDFTNTPVTPKIDYFYNGLGQLVRARQQGTTHATSPVAERVTKYVYDGAGRLESMIDVEGVSRTYVYDLGGRVRREEYDRKDVLNAVVHEAIGADYDLESRVVARGVLGLDVNAHWSRVGADTSYIRYNAFGEVSDRGLNNVAASVYAERFDYDDAGRLWRTTSGDGTWKYFMYDGAGNQTLAIASDGADLDNKTLQQVRDHWASAAAIGSVYVDGVVSTVTRYDGRNLAVEVREPQRERNATTRDDLITQRAYNAFGEVSYEINANLARVDYTYNTMGRVIKTESPTVSITLENGTVQNVRPTELRYYDRSGRLVAGRDANNNLTRLTLLAGTGYGDSKPLIVVTRTADSAEVTQRYDIHGDVRTITDQIGRVTTQTFDKLARLTRVDRPGGLSEYFEYDQLGQRIRTWNSQLTQAKGVWTFYDRQGRVTQQTTMGDHTVAGGVDATQHSYVWSDAIGASGGWTQTTTYANGKTLIEQMDLFGRMLQKTDLGQHVSDYVYDKAGRLIQRSAPAGNPGPASRPVNYTYYNTGRVATATAYLVTNTEYGDYESTVETYGYDKVGNVASEKLTTETQVTSWVFLGYDENWNEIWGPAPTVTSTVQKNATATYDALGRMTNWTEVGSSNVSPSTIAYQYDANGNIRRSTSQFRAMNAQGAPSSTVSTQDYWYRYDSLNRVVTQKGTPGGGTIVRGNIGTDIFYDLAGQRSYIITQKIEEGGGGGGGYYAIREDYAYDAAGRLSQVRINPTYGTGLYQNQNPGSIKAVFTYDTMGRMLTQSDYAVQGSDLVFSRTITYNDKNQITFEANYTRQNNFKGYLILTAQTTYTYGTGQDYALGSPLTVTTQNWTNNQVKPTTRTTNNYVWWDGAAQGVTTYKPDINQTTEHTSTFNYKNIGGQGQLANVGIVDGRPRTVSFVTTLDGQVIRRDEADGYGNGDPHEIWYRFGGRERGYITNNGTLESSYMNSIAARTKKPVGGWAFRYGADQETPYADFDQSLTTINSFYQGGNGGGYTVQAGDTLSSIAAALWGDSSLWYKLAEANGLSAQATLLEGQVLNIPAGVTKSTHNASTFNPYDPAATLGDVSPTANTPPPKKKCGGFGQILLAVIAIAVTILITKVPIIQAMGPIAGGATAAAGGSIVSQAVGVATGIQDKFSWNAVAMAALGGAVSGGMDVAFGEAANWQMAALRGAAGNAITQGISVAAGWQDKFNWASVAAAGVAAGVGKYVSDNIDGAAYMDGKVKVGPTASNLFVSRTASAIAGAATRSLVEGSDFGDNLMAELPSVIGSTIGDWAAEQLKKDQIKPFSQKEIKSLVDGAHDDYESAPDDSALAKGPLEGAATKAVGKTILRRILGALPFVGDIVVDYALMPEGPDDVIPLVSLGDDVRLARFSDEMKPYAVEHFSGLEWRQVGSVEQIGDNLFKVLDPDWISDRVGRGFGEAIITADASDGSKIGFAVSIQNTEEWNLVTEGLSQGWDANRINAELYARQTASGREGPIRLTLGMLDSRGRYEGRHNAGPNAPIFKRWLEKGRTIDLLPNGDVRYTRPIDGRAVSLVYRDGFGDFSRFEHEGLRGGLSIPVLEGRGTGDTQRYKDQQSASRRLGQMIEEGAVSEARFTATELADIRAGRHNVGAFTWHHGRNSGEMQLVLSAVHSRFSHRGWFSEQ